MFEKNSLLGYFKFYRLPFLERTIRNYEKMEIIHKMASKFSEIIDFCQNTVTKI